MFSINEIHHTRLKVIVVLIVMLITISTIQSLKERVFSDYLETQYKQWLLKRSLNIISVEKFQNLFTEDVTYILTIPLENQVIHTSTTVVRRSSDARDMARSNQEQTREGKDGCKIRRSDNRELCRLPQKSIKGWLAVVVAKAAQRRAQSPRKLHTRTLLFALRLPVAHSF